MIQINVNAPKILVIGDLIIDHYLWGLSERISPEAPVPVIDINSESTVLGGAGNVINNLKTLGADVDFISVIGDCKNSIEIKNLFNQISVNTKFLFTQNERITSKKSRVISSQQQVLRYDIENAEEISNKSQKLIIETFKKIIKNYQIVLLSDYGKGVLTRKITKSIISLAKKNKKRVLVDPKGSDYSKYEGSFLLTPNIKEASEATNIKILNDNSLKKSAIQLKSDCNLEHSLITLSDRGVAIYDEKFRIYPTVAREVFDVTGAGDTILAALGLALALDYEIDEAVKFANLAAGVVIGKIGSATATLNEIDEYESSINKSTSDMHIKTKSQIIQISQNLRVKKKKIVFTNGCFDLLHTGHVKYLEKSKSFGDILIVGINSDKSVKALKGENRPINLQEDRAYILASLEAVDYVVIFDEETPINLINDIKPQILVKGADYKRNDVVGKDIVNELKLVKLIHGKSTTKIIETIKQIS
jgi:D-beta-D-heptose 7-phosphate kinase / D-beta-D-heptose 1-phosphate adenosyltransferase